MSKPKVLIFDIETLPMEVYAWGLYDQNFSIEMIKQPTTICSFSARFLGEKRFHEFSTRYKRDIRDDKQLVSDVQKLLSTADVLVSQNGINFDIKKINSRAYFNNDPQRPDKKKHVDLLLEGKRVFGHDSHKLAWISRKLAPNHQKSSHKKFPGFELHKGVLDNNPEAWDEMIKYNRQDIIATEEVYKDYMTWFHHIDLRPFFIASPGIECRACGGNNLTKYGTSRIRTGLFQKYRCNDCSCITTPKGVKFNLDKKKG